MSTRRSLLGAALVGAIAAPIQAKVGDALRRRARLKAIAFDGFPIIDATPVAALARTLFPDKGDQLTALWRSRQFEYTWLRTLSNRYVDFWRVTQEALAFAARSLELHLDVDTRDRLMQSLLSLQAWPDVLPALRDLRAAGIRMAFLSNLTAEMLDASLRNSGLTSYFEDHLTTDRVHAYKPDPRAYQMALGAFGYRRDEILFVASASWDAAGAKWFGYPTFWLNRAALPAESIGVAADAEGTGMTELVPFALSESSAT